MVPMVTEESGCHPNHALCWNRQSILGYNTSKLPPSLYLTLPPTHTFKRAEPLEYCINVLYLEIVSITIQAFYNHFRYFKAVILNWFCFRMQILKLKSNGYLDCLLYKLKSLYINMAYKLVFYHLKF